MDNPNSPHEDLVLGPRFATVIAALKTLPDETHTYFVIALQSRARSMAGDGGFDPDTLRALHEFLAITSAYFTET